MFVDVLFELGKFVFKVVFYNSINGTLLLTWRNTCMLHQAGYYIYFIAIALVIKSHYLVYAG